MISDDEAQRDEYRKFTPILGAYFVTITLSPKLYKYSSTTQYELTIGELRQLFETSAARWAIVPELTDKGNIHYHGWIVLETKYAYILFLNKLKRKKSLGFCKINDERIKDIDRVFRYMFKEFRLTRTVIKSIRHSLPIHYNEYE